MIRKLTNRKRKNDNSEIHKGHFYKEFFTCSPNPFFILDEDGRFLDVSQGFQELIGFSRSELVQSQINLLVHKNEIEKINSFIDNCSKGKKEEDFLLIDKSKATIRVRITITTESTKLLYGSVKKMTKTEQGEALVGEDRFESLVGNSSDVFGVLDVNGVITYQSKAVMKILGYNPNQMIGHSCFDYVVEEDIEAARQLFDKVLVTPNKSFTKELRLKKANDDWLFCEVNITNHLFDKSVEGITISYRDITDRKLYENKIQQIPLYDHLTGLPNRNSLESMFLNTLANSSKLALLFINLDRFKVINDSLGHSVGDLLLQRVTDRLKSSIGEKDILFRQGGDEFIILLADGDRNRAKLVSEKIIDNLFSPISINSYDIFTSPSIGISFYPEDGVSIEQITKHAHYAMHQAKKSGRNNFHFYTFCEHKPQVNPLIMEMELHKAIERNELDLYYQPKVDLKTGAVVGVEALMRWTHPELGAVSPADFIPLAEDTGLIIPMGKWAIRTACKQNKRWQEQGLKPIVISVNLSVRQFSQVHLVETVANILTETNLDPNYLELEITESMTANLEYTIQMLKQLKDLGVRISIDDFGTGFSSLNYLKEFPVDTLKIDQSFVREIHNNTSDQTIVKTIISMARNLDLNVVAEGIETREQLVFLQENLCSEGQGYLFSKPLPAAEIKNALTHIEAVLGDRGFLVDGDSDMRNEEFVSIAKKELQDTLRRQQGMTLKLKKSAEGFIHTLCEGELVYRFGLRPEGVVGRRLIDFLPYKVAMEKERYYERAWNGEEQVTYEAYLNGIYYLAALRPIKRGGKVVEVIASCIDVTKLKEVERALRESEEKYRLIAENGTDLICILDHRANFEYASPSFENVLSLKRYSLEGTSYFDIVHPEDQALVTQYKLMIDYKQSFNSVYRLRNLTENNWIIVEAIFNPIKTDNGKVKQIVVIARDITEKRQAEELLWKFEKLSVAGELAASVAHEIKNPLTSIKGFIQLLAQGLFKEEYCGIILKEFNQLDEKLNEFLTLSKPQANQLKTSDLSELLANAISTLETDAANVKVELEIENDLPGIICEPNQIKRVFINLLENSIEAMPSGGSVQIKVQKKPEQLVVTVIDEGIGLSQERIDKLGEPFYSNKEKGTGLGLMICYRIIKEHYGTINIHSREHVGTTVEVSLPIDYRKYKGRQL